MIKKIVFFGYLSFLFNLFGGVEVYLSVIKNETGFGNGKGGILYKVGVPDEHYVFLLPPGTTKKIGTWVNLSKQSKIFLAPLKGDGDPIFIEWGPESAGKCKTDVIIQSVIYWQGAQNASSSEKTYQTYCLDEDIVELGMKIRPNGTPEIYVIKGAQKVSQV